MRGRVVMLVDNEVRSDARVQKAARSVAEGGWDVTLLGLTRDTQPQTWMVGPATVRLIPMPPTLTTRSPMRRQLAQAYGLAARTRPGRVVTGQLDRAYTRYWQRREGNRSW